MELWLIRPRAINELSHALELFFALGHEPFQARAVIQETRLCFLGNEVDDLGEDAFGGMKELRVFAGHALISVAVGLPPCAPIRRRPKDIAFAGKNEIGMD